MKKFVDRHVGISEADLAKMLKEMKVGSVDELIQSTIPQSILSNKEMELEKGMSEAYCLRETHAKVDQNQLFRSYIGMGYYGTLTPAPILRNIFNNPGWYTQYTPYQAEISQGRLEALLNFQTMVSDLTGLPIANASLLDEGTAAAEAMIMLYNLKNKRSKTNPANVFLVDKQVFPQTIDVLKTRAKPLGISIEIGTWKEFQFNNNVFAALVQYPNMEGEIIDYSPLTASAKEAEGYVVAAADLLSLTLLKPPGEWDVDIVVGNTQRFGIPMGFGGPHAAYFATKEKFKRQIPGRIIGVSVDAHGQRALRMALQTREQHIRRERATSNICTAQALLAIMAGMYAVYHGPEGLREIAYEITGKASFLKRSLLQAGYQVDNHPTFDTISIRIDNSKLEKIKKNALARGINLFYTEDQILISLDETVLEEDLLGILEVFDIRTVNKFSFDTNEIPESLMRNSPYLTHAVFQKHQTETRLMRYIKSLENKDLSLTHAMIPLGSCTMKLNAASQLIPLSWPKISHIHPFVPRDQVKGYLEIIDELASDLCEITGFSSCSFQPNSGAQGEYTGLLVIKAFHEDHGNFERDVTLIPSSAHGTNPASAIMAGMKVVIVQCDEEGNIDLSDLKTKAEEYNQRLAALMITYPSTHGVFEENIVEICQIIHDFGGLVYMDGANMNAQVGFTNPGLIGADVCHLNLHKTFAIPHGGGGPGMGPICVNKKLEPYLPGHIFEPNTSSKASGAVSSAHYGSASILLISYAYIKMLGKEGLKKATVAAIVNANYIRTRLSSHYDVLYVGAHGFSAHELIIDIRPFKDFGIDAEDVAKRLIDYGFHAPTLSFPVAGTLMIEPTESEDLEELDMFCEAMIQIRKEIDEVEKGVYGAQENVLVNAPHTIASLTQDPWPYPYSREKAVYPLPWLRQSHKFWAPVSRVDNAYGDRNLICTCPPIEAYMDSNMVEST